MTSSIERALQIPEILQRVAYWLPLFEPKPGPWTKPYSYVFSPSDDFEREYSYAPHNLLPCTLVSRLWNHCFTPYLYHYCIQRRANQRTSTESIPSGFQRNSHHIRRYLAQPKDSPERYRKGLALSPPNNLLDLFLYSVNDENAKLLHCNQGPRLRRLVWHRGAMKDRMAKVHQDALTNLPCLEELDLSGWVMSDDFLFKILKGCSRTLKTLRLQAIQRFEEGVYAYIPDITGDEFYIHEHELMLWNLKSLSLRLDLMSRTAQILMQVCPSLEEFRFGLLGPSLASPLIVDLLRKHCPKLHTIHNHLSADGTDYRWISNPEAYASVFKDGCPTGLKHASLTVPRGADDLTMNALLCHTATLVSLELGFIRDWELHHPTFNMDQMSTLFTSCGSLKELRLSHVNCSVESLEQILVAPWTCQDLEVLVIDGYRPSDWSIRYQTLSQSQWGQRMQRAYPHNRRQYDYGNDGQGWVMRPELDPEALYNALIDAGWKRRLFDHMYTKSGVRQVKYVRLNETEFFAKEQFSESLKTGKEDLELENASTTPLYYLETYDESAMQDNCVIY